MTLDQEMFARYLGMYIMKLEIPQDLHEYITTHKCPSDDVDVNMMFATLQNAPDFKSEPLRDLMAALI